MSETTQVVAFNITDSAIATLADKYSHPNVMQYDQLKTGIREVSKIRIAIDKERKEQTAAALAHQRAVNAEGSRIIDALKLIEDPMKACKAEVDDEADRKVRKAEEAEDLRLQGIHTRLDKIAEYGRVSINDDVELVKKRLAKVDELDPTVGFDEFAKQAAEVKATALESLYAGVEALEKQADLDRRSEELAERERIADEKQAELDAEKNKREAEERQQEQDRLRQLEDDERDRQAKIDEETEQTRRDAMKPDKAKLMVFAQELRELKPPEMATPHGVEAMKSIASMVEAVVANIEAIAEQL